jgi:cysteine-rich repeat protein
LLVPARDVIALDAENAVVDPACGAARLRARFARGEWRLRARWPTCRTARVLRLTGRASADCTLLRGRATGRRPTRFVAIASRCGDGLVDPGLGERCDDGNLSDTDGCESRCGRCIAPATLPSTLAAVQANVFDRACVNCHGAQPTAGLDLRAPGAHARLVGVATASGLFQIAPGDRTRSLVWLKIAKASFGALEDLPGAGMPIGFPLPGDVAEALGVWIDAGAPAEGLVPGTDDLRPACP